MPQSLCNRLPLVRTLFLLFLFFSGTGIFMVYGQIQHTLAKAEISDGIVARMTSKLLEEHEKNVLAALRACAVKLTFIDGIKNRDVAKTHSHLADVKSSSAEIDLAFVTDDKGLLWANYPEFSEAIGHNLSDRDWFKGVSSSWQPYVSAVFQLIVDEKPLAIAAAVPIFDLQGQVVGILAESNRLATIEALLDNSLQNGRVYVLDRIGTIIYDSKQHGLRQILAYPLQAQVRHILESGQNNGEISDPHDGRKKKILAVAQNDVGWTVVVERTMGETLLHDYKRYISTAAIFILCFLLIAGFFLHQRSQHDKTQSLLELERQLRQREKIYRKLMDTIPGIVYSFSDQHADVYFSPEVETILGYSPDLLKARPTLWHDSIHPDHVAQVDQAIAEAKSSGKAELEYIIYDKHGQARWLFDRMTSLINNSGETVINGIASDVTERKRVEEELKTSEANYRSAYTLLRSLCDNVPDMIWAKDLDKRYLFANKSMCRGLLNAVDTDEPVGKTDLFFAKRERTSHADLPQWHTFGELCRDSDEVTMEAGTPMQFDETGNVRGQYLFLDVHKAPFFNDQGMMIGTVGSARDVTAIKEMEQHIKEREERLDLAIQGADLGTWDWHIPSGNMHINNRWAEMLGYTAEEMVPHLDTWVTMVHPDDIGRVQARLESHLSGEINYYESEHRLRHKSGEWIWVLDKGRVIDRDAQGNPLRACGTHLDITRQKILIEQSRDGVFIIDSQGKVRDTNQRAAEMLGYTPEEVRHLHVWDWDAQWTREELLQMIDQVDSSGDFFETWHRRKDGTAFPVEISSNGAILDGEKQVFCVCRDITERKRMEEERTRLQAQLVHAQKMESIGTLAGGIAHDFNNILGAVIGYAEMVKEESQPGSRIAQDIDRVLEAGNRAASVVKQILAFSRQHKSERVPVDPGLVIKEAVGLLRPTLPSTIAVSHRLTASHLVFVDPNQLHQVIMNLVTNAFHAMEKTGGRLEIATEDVGYSEANLVSHPGILPGTFVLISVADNGPGILPEIRDRIFDPYFTTKEVGKGTGMGLAIVDGIVRGSGGFITCESEPGKGTIFTLSLPACNGKTANSTENAEVIPAAGGGRILLIDDEELLANLGKSMLERLGYEVTAHTTSIEALIAFQNDPHRFDAVVTDQTMPGITGLDLARRMLQIRPDLPIILCTGYSNLVDEAQAKAYGIKGFAMKPLNKKAIADFLQEAIGGCPRQS